MRLTDREYDLIRDLLPNGSFKGRNKPDNRLFLDGVLYIAKTGCGWRQLPMEYGKWYSVWKRFRRWSIMGIWDKIFDKLKSKNEETIAIDSTCVKVHQDACRYIKKLQTREPYRQDQRGVIIRKSM